jgi:hypothetical protein
MNIHEYRAQHDKHVDHKDHVPHLKALNSGYLKCLKMEVKCYKK